MNDQVIMLMTKFPTNFYLHAWAIENQQQTKQNHTHSLLYICLWALQATRLKITSTAPTCLLNVLKFKTRIQSSHINQALALYKLASLIRVWDRSDQIPNPYKFESSKSSQDLMQSMHAYYALKL